MTNCVSEQEGMSIDDRFSQLRKDIYYINTLAFPLHLQGHYKALTNGDLIDQIRRRMTHDNVSIECDLVTIGWLVIAFYIGQNARYAELNYITNLLYHESHMDDVLCEDVKLFHMALEIGTRVINREGEADSFEQSSFDYETYKNMCTHFYNTRKQESVSEYNEKALENTQSLLCRLHSTISRPSLYKESTLLDQLSPTGYASIRNILNRAINAVNPEREPYEAANFEYKTQISAFKIALEYLKPELLTAYRSKNCDAVSAVELARLVLNLAQRIENKTLNQSHIDSFIKATDKYRTIATMNAKLNKLIYAGVAIIALLCTATAIMAGAGVVGTILATTAGLGVGLGAGRFTIWQKNKTMLTRIDSLTQEARLTM